MDKDGILRVNSRLCTEVYSYSECFPIFLPSTDHITGLIIKFIHDEHHINIVSTMSMVRSCYYVPKLRQTCRKIVHNCSTCKKLIVKHYKLQKAPVWPPFRVERSRPFAHCGVDLTGHLYIKNGKQLNKCYCVLFTCTSTRAVNLEIVQDLTAASFELEFRRFYARRGTPECIISDNASNFTAFIPHLHALMSQPEIGEFFLNHKIVWQLLPSRSPWYGGFFEKLIHLTKYVLKRCIGKRTLALDELATIVAEVENCLNNRPLGCMSNSPNEMSPISPNSLIYGYSLNSFPHLVDLPETTLVLDNPFKFKSSQLKLYGTLQKVWNLFNTEYIRALRDRDMRKTPFDIQGTEVPNPGDVVMILDDKFRALRLARILDLVSSNDGQIRAANIMFGNKNIAQYPLARLSKLESCDTGIPACTDNALENTDIGLARQPHSVLLPMPLN